MSFFMVSSLRSPGRLRPGADRREPEPTGNDAITHNTGVIEPIPAPPTRRVGADFRAHPAESAQIHAGGAAYPGSSADSAYLRRETAPTRRTRGGKQRRLG